jgi:hypothetical protein
MNTKKLLIIICIIANQFINSAKAQAPQSFNYQAVARDASGAVISNQAVSFRISLLQGSATGTSSYTETHSVTTNQLGLVNFAIGGGTVVSGNFANINWSNGPYFVKVELDANGGNTYVVMNTTQLLSVPYAMYAGNGATIGQNVGDMMYWNGSSWTNLTVGAQGQVLTMCGGIPTWGGCLAQLTTTAVTNITTTTATVGGNIANDGGSTVTARGVCYSTSQNPTIVNSIVSSGSGVGSFSCNLTGLQFNTTYYTRAYATNVNGTAYGNQQTFTTSNTSLATIVLDSLSMVIKNADFVILGQFHVISNGGSTISFSGLCYDTLPNPTLANNHTAQGNNLNNQSDTIYSYNLIFNKTYYVRAYATNLAGTSYSNTLTITPTLPYFTFNGTTTYVLPFNDIWGFSPTKWGPSANITNATSNTNGQSNTTQIVTNQGSYNNGNYAAKYCNDLVKYGFSDWYLPSKDELTQMGVNITGITDINSSTNAYYWSSTESSSNNVWAKILNPNTAISNVIKTNTYRARCIRHQ